MGYRVFFLAGLAGLLSFISLSAYAGARKVYFSAVGRNSATTALTTAQSAKCVLFLTNRSANDQKFKFNLSSSTPIATDPTVTPGPSHATNYTTLTAGSSISYTLIFTAITSGVQEVVCAGSITAEDSAANAAGFISANASLVTFYESTPKTATAGSIETIFSPSNVLINGGSPF
jgi:hypothetical protein